MFDQPGTALGLFIAAGLVIAVAGVRMSVIADKLADRTGFGEALVGAVLLGASTSLSGTVASVTAAIGDYPSLAVSNAVGGIAAQTVFLAIADLMYRRSNLEHAAASETILVQGAALIVLLTMPALAMVTPPVAVFSIHPVTPLLVVLYLFGLRLSDAARNAPMWRPRRTADTRDDTPDPPEPGDRSTAGLGLVFTFLLFSVGVAGWVIANAAVTLAEWSGLSESLVGALFMAVTTSLPELVTTLAAVRRGALQLAVGGIIGGNTFDVLFLVVSDIAYRPGSLYHAVGERELFLILWALLMTGILLLGLIRRERYGIASIGFESAALIGVFATGVAIQVALG